MSKDENTYQLIAELPVKHALINGKWIELKQPSLISVINPSTEEVLTHIGLGRESDVDSAVAAAKYAFKKWSKTSVEERADLLQRIYTLIHERAETLAQLISLEMGAPINYARSAQVPLAAEHVKAARENLLRFEFIKQRGTTAIVREPIGVAGQITPWNWPLYQITAKVAPALAAGCTVVLKPSELSPLSALSFAQLMLDAGVPDGVFNLVLGDGKTVGNALSKHPDVDMISITGSTRAGIEVAKSAASTVKRVAQELGGKSPNILLPDTDFATAVPLGVAACMRNNGQSCSAPTRMLVPKASLALVETLALSALSQFKVGNASDPQSTHGPLANVAQYNKVREMISIGLDEGARCIAGGLQKTPLWPKGYFVSPTIFSDVSTSMTIAKEEIFGPVLCLIPYDSIEEAIYIANDTVFGLGAHVQSANLAQAQDVAKQIRSGQVHINHPAWDPNAPFGGYKQSGNGREYGVEGIEEYLETKAILGFYNEQ
ncbi:aldehyde dehydrogenase family protein [Aestuariibacter sp. GS-14]|uniref:aldehyde dehydrogenase family protein n=1 Tax=Aestuariibacter sp. GS-14 TaxID=2590670 RepID=UPI00112EAD49|nr:aldehyde dehydrogenase family protein [Aestuariibacter sp. GS-14]TPV59980.1 aldehyde dehydrogenase family protein [Aestuariibacter sp. GS-14]